MVTTAILARTNRALRPFEEALTEAGLKYHFVGRSGFFAQIEIRACVDWCSLAAFGPSDWALAGAIRSPFSPSKFLPKTKLLARLKELRTEESAYWHLLTREAFSLVENKNLSSLNEFTRFVSSLSRYRNVPCQQAVKAILQDTQAFDSVAGEEDPDNDAAGNLNEFVKMSAKHSSLGDFLAYVRRATAAAKGKKGVALSTLHSAKGMEWDTVYFVQCAEGIIPHSKSTDLAEERNCLYVGLSRAERVLNITFSGPSSPFIRHLEPKSEQEIA